MNFYAPRARFKVGVHGMKAYTQTWHSFDGIQHGASAEHSYTASSVGPRSMVSLLKGWLAVVTLLAVLWMGAGGGTDGHGGHGHDGQAEEATAVVGEGQPKKEATAAVDGQAVEASAVLEGQAVEASAAVGEGRAEEALAAVDGQVEATAAVLEGQAEEASSSSSSHSDAAQELLDQAERDAEEEKKEARRKKVEEARREKADERRRAEEERQRREAAQRRAEEEQKRSEQRRQQQLEQEQQQEQWQREFQSAVESEVARRLAAARSEQQNVPFVFSLLSAVTTAIDELREERRQAAVATTAQLKRLGEILQGNQELHARQLELVASMMGRELSAEAARGRESRAAPRARCNKCVACTISVPVGCRRGPCESWRTARASDDGGVRAASRPNQERLRRCHLPRCLEELPHQCCRLLPKIPTRRATRRGQRSRRSRKKRRSRRPQRPRRSRFLRVRPPTKVAAMARRGCLRSDVCVQGRQQQQHSSTQQQQQHTAAHIHSTRSCHGAHTLARRADKGTTEVVRSVF